MRQIILFAVLALAVSCSLIGGALSPDEEGERFHRLYSDGDFAALYRTTSELQRQETDIDMFTELMNIARNRLGRVRNARLRSTRRHSSSYGQHVVLHYDTQFERGTAQEAIVYRVGDGERLQLEGYQVVGADEASVLMGLYADTLQQADARENRR